MAKFYHQFIELKPAQIFRNEAIKRTTLGGRAYNIMHGPLRTISSDIDILFYDETFEIGSSDATCGASDRSSDSPLLPAVGGVPVSSEFGASSPRSSMSFAAPKHAILRSFNTCFMRAIVVRH